MPESEPPATSEAAARAHDTSTDVVAPDASDESTPTGAIIVTATLAGIILVFWFSMFALNLLRS